VTIRTPLSESYEKPRGKVSRFKLLGSPQIGEVAPGTPNVLPSSAA
jgi:hypothetical protein